MTNKAKLMRDMRKERKSNNLKEIRVGWYPADLEADIKRVIQKEFGPPQNTLDSNALP